MDHIWCVTEFPSTIKNLLGSPCSKQPRFSCLLISPTLSEHNIGCTPAPHQYWKAYRLVAGRPLPPPHVGSTNPCPSLSLPSRAMPRQRGFPLNLQKPPHGPQSVSESTRKGGEGEARDPREQEAYAGFLGLGRASLYSGRGRWEGPVSRPLDPATCPKAGGVHPSRVMLDPSAGSPGLRPHAGL